MVFSLRKKENMKVRQPLQKVMIPVLDKKTEVQILAVADLIKQEVNVESKPTKVAKPKAPKTTKTKSRTPAPFDLSSLY